MEGGHNARQTSELPNNHSDEPAAPNGAETNHEAESDRHLRSERAHSTGISSSDEVHEVIRNAPRRRGCAGLETLCLIGCFVLIGILTLMHIHFVGDPPGENGCLPVRLIREGKPELIEIRIIGSFSRLASRLRSELSLAIQKRTDVVTIVLNEESRQAENDIDGIVTKGVNIDHVGTDPSATSPHPSRGREGPLAALVKRTVAEPWRRVVESVKRVRSSIIAGQEAVEEAEKLPPQIISDIRLPEPDSGANSQDSFFYLPLRMSSSFTASKVNKEFVDLR